MKYKVSVTETAWKEIEEIYRYIRDNLENPFAAKRIAKNINSKIRSLELFPKATPPKKVRGKKIYLAHAGNFTIAYTISRKEVIVSTVSYSKRNLENILDEEAES